MHQSLCRTKVQQDIFNKLPHSLAHCCSCRDAQGGSHSRSSPQNPLLRAHKHHTLQKGSPTCHGETFIPFHLFILCEVTNSGLLTHASPFLHKGCPKYRNLMGSRFQITPLRAGCASNAFQYVSS